MRWVFALVGLLLVDAAILALWIAGTLGAENCGEKFHDDGWNCSHLVHDLVPYAVYGLFASVALTAVVAVAALGLAGRWVARRARQNK